MRLIQGSLPLISISSDKYTEKIPERHPKFTGDLKEARGVCRSLNQTITHKS